MTVCVNHVGFFGLTSRRTRLGKMEGCRRDVSYKLMVDSKGKLSHDYKYHLPAALKTDTLTQSTSAKSVQWATVEDEESQNLYIVFRGMDDLTDVMFDVAAPPKKHESGIKV